MAKRFRLICSYTVREWIQIDNGAKSLGKKSTLNYLISEIKNLDGLCDSLKNCEDENKLLVEKRTFYPPNDSIEILEKLSKKLKIKPSTLVSRLLLNPLLKND